MMYEKLYSCSVLGQESVSCSESVKVMDSVFHFPLTNSGNLALLGTLAD